MKHMLVKPSVLVDGEANDEEYPLKARTNGGRLVHLKERGRQGDGDSAVFGKFVDAMITHSNNWSLFGEVEN